MFLISTPSGEVAGIPSPDAVEFKTNNRRNCFSKWHVLRATFEKEGTISVIRN